MEMGKKEWKVIKMLVYGEQSTFINQIGLPIHGMAGVNVWFGGVPICVMAICGMGFPFHGMAGLN